MSIPKTDAIVLRAIDYSETSQVVWFFTREHGRVHVIAKGSRRPRSPFEGQLEPLVRGEIVFYRSKRHTTDETGLDLLKEFDPVDRYPGIRADLARFYRGTYVIELLRELSIPDEPMPALFDAAVATLETLARGEARVLDAVLAAFEVRALRASGIEPSLDRCVECDAFPREETLTFAPVAGGVVCRAHRGIDAHAFEAPREALHALAVLGAEERPRGRVPFGPEVVREIRRVLDSFIAHRLGKELRLTRHLQAALVVLVLALVGGCASPPASEDESPARPALAAAGLGDASGAAWRDARGGRAARLLDQGMEKARAIAATGDHGAATEAYEAVYRTAPRGKVAEESLFQAAEEAFFAGRHFHALELYTRLVALYPSSAHYPEIDERTFQIGKLYVEEKAKKPSFFLGIEHDDTSYGIEVLEKFVKARDQHALAPEALFLIGEAHVKQDEPELSIESWQRLVKDYPRSSWSRLAEYKIALAFCSLSYGADYDKRPLLTGRKRLQNYVKKYPAGDNVEEAKARLLELEEELAQHDLTIAKKYASHDRFRSARIYLLSILNPDRGYPGTKAAAEAKSLADVWPDPPDPPGPAEPATTTK
jgi:DNA repair protein RecO (recombination protein O)